jgi:hypothetical protein
MENLMDHVSVIFETRLEAMDALNKLEAVGVNESQISLLATDDARGRHFSLVNSTKAEEGATTGATLGGLAGAVIAGIVSAGAVAIPGLNIVVSGYLISALAGLGAGAATGGIVGALVGVGFPEHEAKLYEEEIRSGHFLVSVKPKDGQQKELIENIFDSALEKDAAIAKARTPRRDEAGLR